MGIVAQTDVGALAVIDERIGLHGGATLVCHRLLLVVVIGRRTRTGLRLRRVRGETSVLVDSLVSLPVTECPVTPEA